MGRKRKNHVYAYFNYQKETNTSKCDIEDCNKLIKGNHGTNLLHHLSSKHVAEYNMVMEYNNLANDVNKDKENCGEGTSAEECKSKWRNIRDNYMKNKKKKITGSATSYSKYDDERLNFLSESHDEGETSSKYIVDNASHDPIEISFECVKEEYDSSEDVPLSESPFVMGTSSSSNAEQPPTYTPTIVTTACDASQSLAAPQNFTVLEQNVIPPPKRPMKRKIDSIIDELQKDREERNVILQQLVTKATCPTGKSPIHNFFSSMADIVCNFPPDKIAEVRMKVCNMVSDVELSVLRGRSQPGGSF